MFQRPGAIEDARSHPPGIDRASRLTAATVRPRCNASEKSSGPTFSARPSIAESAFAHARRCPTIARVSRWSFHTLLLDRRHCCRLRMRLRRKRGMDRSQYRFHWPRVLLTRSRTLHFWMNRRSDPPSCLKDQFPELIRCASLFYSREVQVVRTCTETDGVVHITRRRSRQARPARMCEDPTSTPLASRSI